MFKSRKKGVFKRNYERGYRFGVGVEALVKSTENDLDKDTKLFFPLQLKIKTNSNVERKLTTHIIKR